MHSYIRNTLGIQGSCWDGRGTQFTSNPVTRWGAKWRKKKRGRRIRGRYPKTPRAIYHAQRAQQEAKLGMLMWAAGAGSRYACATPRGANHRPRNGGSCARVSSSRATISLGKMEEESHAPLSFSHSLSSSAPSLTLLPFRHWIKCAGGGRRGNEAAQRGEKVMRGEKERERGREERRESPCGSPWTPKGPEEAEEEADCVRGA